MIIFLSLKSFTVFFLYGFIDWIFEGLPIGNGGHMGKRTYAMGGGVVASVCVRTMGRGSDFCYFGACTY